MTQAERPSEASIYELLDLLFGVAGRSNALIADVLRDLDLTHALADALWQLEPEAPPPSMRELAAKLRCDPSTVTFLADRLEDRRLVDRQVDPHNRRVKTLVLTARGRRARRTLVEAMAKRSPIARLAASERRQLRDLLAKAMSGEDASEGGPPWRSRPSPAGKGGQPSRAMPARARPEARRTRRRPAEGGS